MIHLRRVLVAVGVLATGCRLGFATGETKHETAVIERDESAAAQVELRMGAGELHVGSGTSKFADADFVYNVPAWKPNVVYHSGNLTISQPGGSSSFGRTENTWRVKLNRELPLDFTADLGAGEATLELGSLNLNRVKVTVGAGELKLDLRGEPGHDYDVQIRGGVGEATVYFPKDIAIAAKATGGLGGVSTTGLENRNGIWMNPDRVSAPVTIHVEATGGVGQINLIR
jgi:hypothetical protein